METQEQKHIATIDKALTQLSLHGCTEADLILDLFRIQDYLYEKKNEESDKERLASINRDMERLEAIGRKITDLKRKFLDLEAEALELQRQELDKNE